MPAGEPHASRGAVAIPGCLLRITADERFDSQASAANTSGNDPEDSGEGTGGAVWAASVALAGALASEPAAASRCRGRAIVELGAGCGAPGLAAALAGAAAVTLTDLPARLPHLRAQIAANAAALRPASGERVALSVAALQWGEAAAAAAVLGPLDAAARGLVVLGADIGCFPDAHDELAATIAALLHGGSGGPQPATCLLAEEIRWKDVHRFFRETLAENGLAIVGEERLLEEPRPVVLLTVRLAAEELDVEADDGDENV